jgi:hypothetical protein
MRPVSREHLESLASQPQTQAADDWPLDLDSSPTGFDSLYSNGLRELSTKLDQKYNLDSVSSISYALAVDLHCLDSAPSDPEERTAFCMLADRNIV